ncbi:DUF2231 domain-containing protein [Amnibacterium endophyticum]|uniref:DUF2231 domain-containing protein n=1 Tax=Amnibacterium endophyticum TaxID=2109337 RepID=A0ABW4LAU0_9MICO
MRELPFLKPVARLEDLHLLDPVIGHLKPLLLKVMKPRGLEDLLHGVPAGHPVHPVLVQIPIGTWASAALLDALPGTARTSRLLVGTGILAAAPAILTGWADWARSGTRSQRVGLVHAASNEIGWIVYVLSYADRRWGSEPRGRLLGWAAFTLIGVGGYLGGHLAYRQAVGANHAQAVLERFPAGWHSIGPLADLPEERPVRREVEGESLFVLRRGGRVDVLSDVSTHLGEPLTGGVLTDPGAGAATIETAGGSVFEVETGEVVHGPATAPAIVLESRVEGELVEVRLPRP